MPPEPPTAPIRTRGAERDRTFHWLELFEEMAENMHMIAR